MLAQVGVAKPSRTHPTVHAFTALVDTGSDHSLINSSVIESLDLKSIGPCRLSGFDGKWVDSVAYRVSVCLSEADFRLGRASGAEFSKLVSIDEAAHNIFDPKGYDVLLGLDFIEHCVLLISGSRFSLVVR